MKIRVLQSVLLASFMATPAFAQEEPNHVRVRAGFGAELGTAFGGDFAGPAVGLYGQVGAQFTPMFSAYYQLTGLLAIVSGGGCTGGACFNGGAALYNTAFASFTFARRLELAMGPSADLVAVSTPSSTGSPLFAFGAAAKAALHFGHFVLALDVHPSFRQGDGTNTFDPMTTVAIGIGGSW